MSRRAPVLALVAWLGTVGCAGDPEQGGGSCKDRTNAAAATIDTAAAKADLACAVDDDCAIVDLSSACSESCTSVVVSKTGAEQIANARADAEGRICSDFAADGCTVERLPCPGPPHGAACTEGVCREGVPATWRELGVAQVATAHASISTPLQGCTDASCTEWSVTPDGMLRIDTGGSIRSATLSAADLAVVDAVLRSSELRPVEGNVTDRCTPAGDVAETVGFTVSRATETIGFDATGCALVGPAGNGLQKIHAILLTY